MGTRKSLADIGRHSSLYLSRLSSRPLAVTPAGGEVSMGSWPGLRPRGGACPGLESELSWGVSWLDMEEPEGRMGALLNRAGEKSLQDQRDKGNEAGCFQISKLRPTNKMIFDHNYDSAGS